MIGILTEKPSARRNVAKALGGDEGSCNGERYVIANAAGHLYALAEPKCQVPEELSKKYGSWRVDLLPWNENDFRWKYVRSPHGQDLIKNIKSSFSGCDEICIATDLDPTGEGDLLAAEIIFNLGLHKKAKITRMEFLDESEKSLKEAFSKRREIPDLNKEPAYLKAMFRSRWDFLSIQFTRIASGYSPLRGAVRQGRLKSVMVAFVGDALEKLNSYEKIPYFQNRFIDENKVVYINKKEECYDKQELVPNIYKPSEVVLDRRTKKSTPPPKLIDLARLSSMLAGRGYKAKEVLNTYQKMYQDGILSYPRTEDKNITIEQFNEMLPLVDSIAALIGIDKSILTHRKLRTTHVKNRGAHGANRPGTKIPKDIKSLEKYGRAAPLIYTILAKNFLVMFAEDYVYENQKGHIKDYPAFKGSSNVPITLGWKSFFVSDDEDEEDSTSGLGKRGEPFVYEGYPPKPPTPTMSWLMKQLEKNNVGSGATRTSTYSDVTSQTAKNPLLIDTKGKISMTPMGEVSYQLLKGTKIGDVKTTEMVLETMEKIQNGEFNLIDKVLGEVSSLVTHDIKVMKKNKESLRIGRAEYKVVEKESFVNSEGKELSFKKEWGGHTFTDEELEKLKAGEVVEIKGLTNKRGKTYGVRGRLEHQEFKGSSFYGFKMIEFI